MSELTACQRLDIIRHKGRPTAKDYIPLIFDDFFEMHGDRLFGDDGAVMGGIAYFKGIPVTVIAEVKGRDRSHFFISSFQNLHNFILSQEVFLRCHREFYLCYPRKCSSAVSFLL